MNRKSNFTQIIVIILIIALMGGAIWWTKNKNKKENSEFKSNSASEQTKAEMIDSTITQMTPPAQVDESQIETKTYENKDHKVTLQYPANWQQADLGGSKNVTEPLTRENVVYFYLPDSLAYKDDITSALNSLKLLRFVVEKDIKINNENDWFNYIKKKIDNYMANKDLSENYNLKEIKLGNKIDNKFVVIEKYTEPENIAGQDYYIYNNGDLYQFVSRAPQKYFDNFLPYIEKTVNSIKFNQ